MVFSGLKITVDKVKSMREAVEELTTNKVYVGIPSTRTNRKEGPIGNAVLGYIHENGSPVSNIPPRPFLIPGVKAVQPEVIRRLKKAALSALQGNPGAASRTLNAVGLIAQNAVRLKITEGPFIPLKPSTLARRRANGRTGTNPLIDTGQLRASITYVIRKGK